MPLTDRSPQMILARTRFAAVLVLVPMAIAFAWTGEPVWRWAPLFVAACVIGLVSLSAGRSHRLAITAVVVGPSMATLLTGGLASPFAAILVVTTAGSALASGPTRGLVVRVGIAALALGASAFLAGRPGFVPAALTPSDPVGATLAPIIWASMLLVFLVTFATVMASTRAHLDATRARAVSLQADLAENLRARNRELTAISGSLAHELKNPLAAIQGLATHLARKAEGPQAEQLGVMVAEIHRMGDILDGLLDVARPLGSLSLVDVDLADIAGEVVQMHTPFAAEHGVTLSASGSARARVDPRKVRQILLNLVLNAVEAGAKQVDLVAGPGPQIEVRDDGGGIEGDPTRFFASGVTTKETGNGLGLAICAAIVEQHGGSITLENRGGGCVATVLLEGGA